MFQELSLLCEEVLKEARKKPNVTPINKGEHEASVKELLAKSKGDEPFVDPKDAVDDDEAKKAAQELETADKAERKETQEQQHMRAHKATMEKVRLNIAKRGKKTVDPETGKTVWEIPPGATPDDKAVRAASKIAAPEKDPEEQSRISKERESEMQSRDDWDEAKTAAASSAKADFPDNTAKQSEQKRNFVKSYIKGRQLAGAQKELSPIYNKISKLNAIQKTKDLHARAAEIAADPNFEESPDVQTIRNVRAKQLAKRKANAPSEAPKKVSTKDPNFGANVARITKNIEKFKKES